MKQPNGKAPATRRSKALVWALLLLVCSFVAWRLFLMPLWQEFQEMSAARGSLIAENQRLEQKLNRKTQLEEKWELWQEEARRLEVIIPSLEELPRVLGELESLLHNFPLEITSWRAGEVTRFERHAAISFNLSVNGLDRDLLLLLEELERFPHLLMVESATWDRKEEGGSTLDLIFNLVFLSEG